MGKIHGIASAMTNRMIGHEDFSSRNSGFFLGDPAIGCVRMLCLVFACLLKGRKRGFAAADRPE
jgi:hypothetical protein